MKRGRDDEASDSAKKQRLGSSKDGEEVNAPRFEASVLPDVTAINSAQRALALKAAVLKASTAPPPVKVAPDSDHRIASWYLPHGAVVHVVFGFIPEDVATQLLQHLTTDGGWPHWQHGEYNMYGKTVQTPRLLSACTGHDPADLRGYSVTACHQATPEIAELATRVEVFCDKKFLYAQMNYYRDGNDYIGMHRDREVLDNHLVAAVSLGAPRRMLFQCEEDKTLKLDIVLPPGSLCIQGGLTQRKWKHSIPKAAKKYPCGARVSLTFREA